MLQRNETNSINLNVRSLILYKLNMAHITLLNGLNNASYYMYLFHKQFIYILKKNSHISMILRDPCFVLKAHFYFSLHINLEPFLKKHET